MTPDEDATDASPTTCTFTPDELDVREWLRPDTGCSRSVWEGANEPRCVWHAAGVDKPPAALAATVGDGELSGARVRESDLTKVSFPKDSVLVGADLALADLTETDLMGANLAEAKLSRADLTEASLFEADLPGANLQSTVLAGADLRAADLANARLYDADLAGANLDLADLLNADLEDADLPRANLHRASLAEATLRRADLAEAILLDTDLTGANLIRANLDGANLRGTILNQVGLYETSLENVDIDERTTAQPPSLWEREADSDAESGLFDRIALRRLRAFRRSASDPDYLERAEQQYRRTERLYRENDLRPSPALAVQEKHARRKRALAEGRRLLWLRRAFSRWVLGYGLLIWPIIGVMLAVIIVCTLLYPAMGFEDGSLAANATETVTVTYDRVPPSLSWETAQTLGRSLYFSTITFSTLGYGDLFPTGWARGLATIESFIGALSMAYLVSVLSRRAIR